MKRRLLLLSLFLLFGAVLRVAAQDKTVTGRVTSAEDASALPGVNVVVRGSSSGTVTDAQGRYSISVGDGTTLVFSFVGLTTQEIPVNNRSAIDVQLQADVRQLGEVVVTALGIEREEKALPYAVQEVKGDVATGINQPNPLSSLSGRVAGLQITGATGNIGGSSRINLRGVNSISGNNSPLIVLDGVPIDNQSFNTLNTNRGAGGYDYGNMAQYINPDDIESISVLKGPTAAALYGARAANGALIITSKKGRSQKGIGVKVNSGVGFEQVNVLPKYQNLYGGGFEVSDAEGGVGGFAQQEINGQTYSIVDYGTDESWGPRYNGQQVLHWNSFDPWDAQNYLVPRPWQAPANDVRDFFRTGVSWNNNVELSGGNENATFRMSYTNFDLKGYMPNSSLKRNSVFLTGQTKLGTRVNAFGTVNYINNKALGRPSTGYDDNNIMQKFNQWGQRQLDMEEMKAYKNPDGSQRTWNRAAWDDPTPNFSDNPYWTRYENYQNDDMNRVFGNIGFNVDILNWLKFETKLMSDYYTQRAMERVAIGSQAQSSYSEEIREFNENNYQFLLLANKDLSENFSFQGTLGANRMDQRLNRNSQITLGGLQVPNLYTLNNAESVATDDYSRRKRINSVFGQANLGFRDMLYVDFTLRNDWYSTLSAGNNSFLYPSVGTSFVFTGLDALKNVNWLSMGKVRASWAKVGNDTDPYRNTRVYNPALDANLFPYSFGSSPLYSLPLRLNNPNLKPESTQSFEVGAELRFLQNRLGLDVAVYNNATTDQILELEVSGAGGYRYLIVNAGKMTNKGVEVALTGTPVKLSNGFEWDVAVTWARNRNKLIELTEGVNNYTLANAPFAVSLNAIVGESYGSIRGTDFVYDQAGNKVVDAAGRYVASDVKTIGNILPDWTGGISNTFRFKGFDLSALLDFRKGGDFFSTTYMWGTYSGILEHTAANNIRENGVVLDGMVAAVDENDDIIYNEDGTAQTDGRNATPLDVHVWASDHYSGPAKQNVFDGSFVKLRELRFGYTLPAKWTGPIRNARIAAFGRNLAIWGSNVTDFVDPENTTGSGNVQGLEGGALPSLRSYGVNVSFEF
ncbi:MAG: SusC/RagA family TonB-linked outer membrane protein [Cytophagales bacterium]|nr:SusC/RagA family TonB-linked outer membrane protein [Cytophagales bacterium]